MTWGVILIVVICGFFIFPDCFLAVWITGGLVAGLVELREWLLRREIRKGDWLEIKRMMKGDWTLRKVWDYFEGKR